MIMRDNNLTMIIENEENDNVLMMMMVPFRIILKEFLWDINAILLSTNLNKL